MGWLVCWGVAFVGSRGGDLSSWQEQVPINTRGVLGASAYLIKCSWRDSSAQTQEPALTRGSAPCARKTRARGGANSVLICARN